MFWLQLGMLIALNLIILALLVVPAPNPLHCRGSGGAADGRHLIDDVEAEPVATASAHRGSRTPGRRSGR